jgi:hypothetical protein
MSHNSDPVQIAEDTAPMRRDCSKVDRLWFGRYSGICVDRQNG